jgi:hypothetical protein
MSNTQSQKISAKNVAIVIGVAILTAVIVTLIQTLILGKANIAVTGGVVGATTAVLAIKALKKSPNRTT